MHVNHVKNLKEKLYAYNVNPFESGPACNITTRAEINQKIVEGLLKAPETGDKKHKEIVSERLMKGDLEFFAPIKKMIDTGMKKKVKTPKVVTVLKQDRQAFGTLLSKGVSLNEAFQYSVTSLPLSIANPDSTLRQSSKHVLRNFTNQESKSIEATCPDKCRWLIDGMAAIRWLKARKTYKEWIQSLIQFLYPADDKNAICIEIVTVIYKKKV
eukprot:gene20960-23010_t